jgi:hypothetical protein
MGAAIIRALPRPRGRRVALAAGAAAVLALALAALVSGGVLSRSAPRAAPAARPYDGMLAGLPLQRANCTSWHTAAPAQQRQAVRGLSATIGGASSTGGVGTTMPDAAVAALFDRVCSTPGTANFVLYLIYARAAAFSHQGPTPITAPPADKGL